MSIEKRGAEFDLGDICRAVEAEHGLPHATVRLCIERFAAILPAAIAEHGRVEIQKLGVFFLEDRAPRTGYNFQTGEEVDIPARQKVIFNPATGLTKSIEQQTGKPTY